MTKRVRIVALGWLVAAGLVAVGPAAVVNAAATATLVDWEMNEPPGATVMVDSGGSGINGAIGPAVLTGVVEQGATGYRWTHTQPAAPPPKPERLILVDDARLNPGTRDFAITIRFRTTHSYGNMIQKGQANTPGGNFKWEIPKGRLLCLFRGFNSKGQQQTLRVRSPEDALLNDGVWHTVRCERTGAGVTMTIDGTTSLSTPAWTGSVDITNTFPLTIGGKPACDQITTTCDYFGGDIDWVKIEVPPTGPPDLNAPTTPGTPTGVSNSFTTIDLTWAGSTDDVSTTINYRIFRDGAEIASTSSSAPVVSFTDTGLEPESSHVYEILAVDGALNESGLSPPSESIPVQSAPPVIFFDDFSAGLAAWATVIRVTVDNTTGNPAAPSAGVQVSQQSAVAAAILPVTLSTICMSGDVNETQFAANVLMRLRTASDGPILRVSLDTAGRLRLRSDVSGLQSPAAVPLGTGWHSVELCGSVGATGAWDLYLDGVKILDKWVADTGTTPVGRINIGDTSAKTWSANFDQVQVDVAPG